MSRHSTCLAHVVWYKVPGILIELSFVLCTYHIQTMRATPGVATPTSSKYVSRPHIYRLLVVSITLNEERSFDPRRFLRSVALAISLGMSLCLCCMLHSSGDTAGTTHSGPPAPSTGTIGCSPGIKYQVFYLVLPTCIAEDLFYALSVLTHLTNLHIIPPWFSRRVILSCVGVRLGFFLSNSKASEDILFQKTALHHNAL